MVSIWDCYNIGSCINESCERTELEVTSRPTLMVSTVIVKQGVLSQENEPETLLTSFDIDFRDELCAMLVVRR